MRFGRNVWMEEFAFSFPHNVFSLGHKRKKKAKGRAMAGTTLARGKNWDIASPPHIEYSCQMRVSGHEERALPAPPVLSRKLDLEGILPEVTFSQDGWDQLPSFLSVSSLKISSFFPFNGINEGEEGRSFFLLIIIKTDQFLLLFLKDANLEEKRAHSNTSIICRKMDCLLHTHLVIRCTGNNNSQSRSSRFLPQYYRF